MARNEPRGGRGTNQYAVKGTSTQRPRSAPVSTGQRNALSAAAAAVAQQGGDDRPDIRTAPTADLAADWERCRYEFRSGPGMLGDQAADMRSEEIYMEMLDREDRGDSDATEFLRTMLDRDEEIREEIHGPYRP